MIPFLNLIGGISDAQAAPIFYGSWAGIVVGFSLLIITKWRQKPYGRFLEGYNGVIGIMRFKAGGGLLGKMTRYSERFWFFDSHTRKNRVKTLVSSMPGGVTQLDQREGGVSFALIDGDKRVTVNPDVEAWGEAALGELAESHDWPTFVCRWKLGMLEEELQPQYSTVDAATPEDTLVSLPINGQLTQIKWGDLKPEQKTTYTKAANDETTRISARKESTTFLRLKLAAVLDGSGKYVAQVGVDKKGKPVTQKLKVDPAEVTEMRREFNREIESSRDKILDAVVMGRMVTTQAVAAIVRGLPDAAYVNALKAEMEERIRKEIRGEGLTLEKVIPVVALLIGGAIAFGIIYGFLK